MPRRGAAGGEDMNLFHDATRPPARPCAPSAKPSFRVFRLRLPIFMAGGLGGAVTPVPFPNTDVKGPRGDGTTPRSVGEQRAAGLLFQAPSLSTEAGGLFLCAGQSPRVFMPRWLSSVFFSATRLSFCFFCLAFLSVVFFFLSCRLPAVLFFHAIHDKKNYFHIIRYKIL